jgi:signal transduction histidine kinase
MSHELRTPLNAVIGYSEMLEEAAQEAGQKDYVPDLQKIQAAGRHLLGLINDILDLSKVEAGKMTLYLETFDVAELVREVATTIHPLVQKNHNVIEVRPETRSAACTRTRRSATVQPAEQCVQVHRARRDQVRDPRGDRRARRVCFQVSDSGIG